MSPARSAAGRVARVERSPARQLPAVHRITLPTPWEPDSVHVYLVDADPLTLIDCGVDDAAARTALDAGLEEFGYAVEDLRRIIVTHYHRDHLGQAETLRERAQGLEVWAHADAAPMIEGFTVERDENIDGMAALFLDYGVPADIVEKIGRARREKIEREPARCRATRVDRLLRSGDSIAWKDLSFEVIHSPGHTAGHILLHHPASRVLVSGDQILGGAVPHTENYYLDGLPDPADPLHRRPRFKGLLEYRRSLRALRQRSFSTILPGFGPTIATPERSIRDALLFYEVRIQRIQRSLRSVAAMGQAVTAFEIWRALFPNDDPVTAMRARLLMVIGALDVLEEEGLCSTSRREDGVLVHSAG